MAVALSVDGRGNLREARTAREGRAIRSLRGGALGPATVECDAI
jgi:hypothetical protein